MNKELLAELGRTSTVQDVEAAYHKLFEAKRQYQVRLRNAKNDAERGNAEMEVFLDDLQHITGLPLNSRLFITIACMTIGKRMTRARVSDEYDSPLMEGFEQF